MTVYSVSLIAPRLFRTPQVLNRPSLPNFSAYISRLDISVCYMHWLWKTNHLDLPTELVIYALGQLDQGYDIYSLVQVETFSNCCPPGFRMLYTLFRGVLRSCKSRKEIPICLKGNNSHEKYRHCRLDYSSCRLECKYGNSFVYSFTHNTPLEALPTEYIASKYRAFNSILVGVIWHSKWACRNGKAICRSSL